MKAAKARVKAIAVEADYKYIVVSGFAGRDENGKVEEVDPFIRGALLTLYIYPV